MKPLIIYLGYNYKIMKNNIATKKIGRGGSRTGSGRPKKYKEGVAVSLSFSVPEALVDKIKKYVDRQRRAHVKKAVKPVEQLVEEITAGSD